MCFFFNRVESVTSKARWSIGTRLTVYRWATGSRLSVFGEALPIVQVQ